MCGTSICTVLLWLVDLFGTCFVSVIDAAAVGGIAILDENIPTVVIQDFCPIMALCVSDHQFVLLPQRDHDE